MTTTELIQAVQVLRRVLERARPGADVSNEQLRGAILLAVEVTEAAAEKDCAVSLAVQSEDFWRQTEALAERYGADVRVKVG
jgi:hypothetical protein